MPGKDPTVILNAVVAEEPDGYRGGRRRRFWWTRRGGVALPGLLIAGSVVVVLIVVGVSRLLPHDATGHIPLGGGNGTVTDDQGAAQPDPADSGLSSASPRSSRSASARPAPSPSGGVSRAPGPPAAPGVPSPPAGTPRTTTPGFRAVSAEAEAATLGGGAKASACGTCSGGSKVRQIGANAGFVTVSVPGLPVAGKYQLTITYELGQPSRTFYLSVNGGTGTPVTVTSNTTDWNAPLSATVDVSLAAGTNTIKFYNPTAEFAPDLDRVSVR